MDTMIKYAKITLLLCAASNTIMSGDWYKEIRDEEIRQTLEKVGLPIKVLQNEILDYDISNSPWLSVQDYDLEITFMSETEKKKQQVEKVEDNFRFKDPQGTTTERKLFPAHYIVYDPPSNNPPGRLKYRLELLKYPFKEHNTSCRGLLTDSILITSHCSREGGVIHAYISVWDLTNQEKPIKIRDVKIPEHGIIPTCFKASLNNDSITALATSENRGSQYEVFTITPKLKGSARSTPKPPSFFKRIEEWLPHLAILGLLATVVAGNYLLKKFGYTPSKS